MLQEKHNVACIRKDAGDMGPGSFERGHLQRGLGSLQVLKHNDGGACLRKDSCGWRPGSFK
jgi:hypothetical protein